MKIDFFNFYETINIKLKKKTVAKIYYYSNFNSISIFCGFSKEEYGSWDYSFAFHVLFIGFRLYFKTKKSSIGTQC